MSVHEFAAICAAFGPPPLKYPLARNELLATETTMTPVVSSVIAVSRCLARGQRSRFSRSFAYYVNVSQGSRMKSDQLTIADHVRAYRRRLAAAGAAAGARSALPRETVALLDELKQRQGLRNRSQALLQLIEQGREAAQQ